MKTPSEILSDAAVILGQHEWLKGRYASDKHGVTTYPYDPEATAFCLTGAIKRAAFGAIENFDDMEFPQDALRAYQLAMDTARDALGNPPSVFNDREAKDKNEVIEFLRAAAIKAA